MLHLSVDGHVNPTKNIARGYQVSLDRALAVCERLSSGHNIDAQYLHAKGYGGSMPLGDPSKNRRVEITVMMPEDVEAEKRAAEILTRNVRRAVENRMFKNMY